MFYEQLFKICKEQHTTPTALIKSIGLSSSKITAWKNGSIPKYGTLIELSEKLSVSVASFFLEENEKLVSSDATIISNFSKEAKELVDVYNSLDLRGQAAVISAAYAEQDRMNGKSETKTSTVETA